ncbi:MAG: histidinol-phosphatase [Xanthobacteraceae bacterium]|nr:histidinol-phosphatase [Xanthobacteraceae bacterium]MBX3535447.1 histidinol-phosphatase [Xanthobacteraceae bacterium]MBX3550521.1 histidinol-phosphatase [Xanthobacteraceae bacterium]MCW5675039.1 histidinol-phosphatase [Xanthobacteraceae bacterium]MCW5676920.1 histidinol-phosphatase [Xanthobacteraceae bacterium]
MGAVDFAAFVDELAKVAGDAILPFFRTALSIENKKHKGAFDPVTAADRAAETAMRALIRKTFPAHGVVGEEFDDVKSDAPYTWVLDPIDGTKSFIAGMPVWGTLIGLCKDDMPVYGMMAQPFIGERFTGDGAKAKYRGPAGERKLMTRACASLADALLFTTSPLLFTPDERARFDDVEKDVRLSRYGGDCYAYCMIAAGYADLVIEAGLDAYDIVPLIPIIEGAGGIVTTWQGESAANGGRIVAAGDKRVHAAALEILNQ